MPRESSGAGWIRTNVLEHITEAADWSGTGAVTLVSGFTPGYTCEVEEFGCIIMTALVGASGTQTFNLTDGTNTIAVLTVTQAAGSDGAVVKTSAFTTSGVGIRDAFKQIRDGTALTLNRSASGTTITAGQGKFYVKVRQRLQQR